MNVAPEEIVKFWFNEVDDKRLSLAKDFLEKYNVEKKENLQHITIDVGGDLDHQSFRVEPGTHTVMIDKRYVRQAAIADFVNKLLASYKKHSGNAANEDVALAIGYFDVPVELIYNDSNELALSDEVLGMIVRHRLERKQEDGK